MKNSLLGSDLPRKYSGLARPLIAAALLSGSTQACNSQLRPHTSAISSENAEVPNNQLTNSAFMTPLMSPADDDRRTASLPMPNYPSNSSPSSSDAAEGGPVIETPEMVIVGKRWNGPWPKMPENCVYTGIVLEHNTDVQPHEVVLENMCYRDEGKRRYVYSGHHVPVESSPNGRYDLPFANVHLQEQDGQLYFVVQTRDRVIKEVLEEGQYEPNTMSFEYKLDQYNVRPIK